MNVGQNATFPFLARIRAQCSVEMTLDRCVQKLRRRLASGHSVVRQKQGMDRTPSFYTSRSIINLSGLGVSDPMPDLSTYNMQGSHHQFSDSIPLSPASRPRSPAASSTASLNEEPDLFWRAPSIVHTVPLTGEGKSLKGSNNSLGDYSGGVDIDEASVCKTTTMARFYYSRRGGTGPGSHDSLGTGSQDEEENKDKR